MNIWLERRRNPLCRENIFGKSFTLYGQSRRPIRMDRICLRRLLFIIEKNIRNKTVEFANQLLEDYKQKGSPFHNWKITKEGCFIILDLYNAPVDQWIQINVPCSA